MNENGSNVGPSPDFADVAKADVTPNQQYDSQVKDMGIDAPPSSDDQTGKEHLEAGIKSDARFDYEKNDPPPALAPIPTPHDPEGWDTANQLAWAEHEKLVEGYRQEFYQEIHSHREHFNDRADPDRLDNEFNDKAIGQHFNRDRE